jgi:hypothetical protein
MSQVTGRIKIKANGILLETKEGAKAQISNVEREMVAGDNGVAGHMEKTVIPYVEGAVIHTDKTVIDDIDIVDGSVTFETDTGHTYILRGATRTTPLEITGGEGELPVRFEGTSMEPV